MSQSFVENYQDQNLQMISAGVRLSDLIVGKNYLIHLDECAVVPFDVNESRFVDLRFFQITKLVYDPTENNNEKLVSVYNSLGSFGSSAVMVIDANAAGVAFYLGVSCPKDSETAGMILERSLHGNFPGIKTKLLTTSDTQTLMEKIALNEDDGYFNRAIQNDRHVAAVSIVPSMRRDASQDGQRFVQGVEKFIDTMMGETYTAIVIADPISKENLQLRKRGLEDLYSALASFESISMTYGQNSSTSVTNSICENFSRSVNRSISNTTGQSASHTTGTNESSGSSSGSSYEGFFGGTHNSGSSSSYGSSESDTWGTSTSRGETEGSTDTYGGSRSDTTGTTTGDNKSFTLVKKNKSISNLLEQIELQLTRIRQSESFGLWESCAYFIAPEMQTAVVGANAYKALLTGDDSNVENSFVNLWNGREMLETKEVLRYLVYARQPRFIINARAYDMPAVAARNRPHKRRALWCKTAL